MNYLFLASGFEEIESIVVIDILRRSNMEITIVSIEKQLEVTGSHHITIKTDDILENVIFENIEWLILPGGMPGTTNLNKHEKLKEIIKKHYEKGGSIAAICAAPLILGDMNLLQGKSATCYPGYESHLQGALLSEEKVVDAGNIVTAKGAGVTIPFALKIVEKSKGMDKAQEIANKIML